MSKRRAKRKVATSHAGVALPDAMNDDDIRRLDTYPDHTRADIVAMGKKMPNARAVENEICAHVAYLDVTLLFLTEYRRAKGQREETILPTRNHPIETLTYIQQGCVGSRLPMEQVWQERDEQAKQWNDEYMEQYNRRIADHTNKE